MRVVLIFIVDPVSVDKSVPNVSLGFREARTSLWHLSRSDFSTIIREVSFCVSISWHVLRSSLLDRIFGTGSLTPAGIVLRIAEGDVGGRRCKNLASKLSKCLYEGSRLSS